MSHLKRIRWILSNHFHAIKYNSEEKDRFSLSFSLVLTVGEVIPRYSIHHPPLLNDRLDQGNTPKNATYVQNTSIFLILYFQWNKKKISLTLQSILCVYAVCIQTWIIASNEFDILFSQLLETKENHVCFVSLKSDQPNDW